MDKTKKIGIFGGFFSPIHLGHINAARYFKRKLELDVLYVIPTGIPPHKNVDYIINDTDRINMLNLAFENDTDVIISDIEIRRSGKSFTIDTVKYIKEKNPNSEIYLYCGTDMVMTFDKWYKPDEILKNCILTCGARNINDYNSIKNKCDFLKAEYNCKYIILENDVIEISSTEIRNKIINNENVKDYLPMNIIEYINENNLYKDNKEKYSETELEHYKDIVESKLGKRRYNHCLSTGKECRKLAEKYGVSPSKAELCGILHDITKHYDESQHLTFFKEFDIILDNALLDSPQLFHPISGSIYCEKKLGFKDKDIINAIRYHTTGRANMSMLEKIVFLADYIEPLRPEIDGLENIRNIAYVDIDKAVALTLKNTIEYNKSLGRKIYIDTLNAYEFYKKFI